MNKNAREANMTRPIDIARVEAKAIYTMKADRPLRLHIVGDCKTPRSAQIVATACKDYTKRSGHKVWTYTHAWKTIPRSKWGDISVLASCETVADAKYAMSRGYAASMVRYKPFKRPFVYKGVKMVPCLEMTKGIKCDECKLCMKDDKLRKDKRVVCFFPHGSGQSAAKRAIFKDRDAGNE